MGSRPGSDPGAAAYARWEQSHPGFRAEGVLLRGWLRVIGWLARPLAGRVPPDVLTLAGASAAFGAAVGSSSSAAGLVAASAALDGLDGAVATAGDREMSSHGRALDHVADRFSDGCFAVCLVRAGAPRWLAAGAALASTAQESLREVRGADVRGLVTVGERPVRVIVTMIGIAAPGRLRRPAATLGAAIWLATSALAVARLWSTRLWSTRLWSTEPS